MENWRKSSHSCDGNCVEVAWRKSSRSGLNGCVEVTVSDYVVLVRDSKHPDGPVLEFTHSEWEAFLAGARDREFDLPAPSLGEIATQTMTEHRVSFEDNVA